MTETETETTRPMTPREERKGILSSIERQQHLDALNEKNLTAGQRRNLQRELSNDEESRKPKDRLI